MERLSRACSALVLSSCAALHTACADFDDAEGAREEVTPVLEQAAGGPKVTPTQEQTVTVKTQQVPVIGVTANMGSGCRGKLVAREDALKFASLEVRFTDDYLIKFPINSSVIYDTKECLIRLRVTGAQGYKYAISRVAYVGSAVLLSDQSMAIFDSSVWWSGRKPSRSTTPAKQILPPHLVNWDHTQAFRLEAERESACFDSADGRDEVTIYTMMSLLNPDPSEPAEVRLDTILSDAAIEIDIEPRRCTPP